MSLFAKLFGGKPKPDATPKPESKPELYAADFRIFVEPIKEASGYRVAARIEKDIDGVTKTHMMIRADTMSSEDDARAASLHKAQVFIDQMGDGIFG